MILNFYMIHSILGSENNTCYLYANELSKPILSYRFDEGAGAKKEEVMTDFVSAVCWDNVNYSIFFLISLWKVSSHNDISKLF